MNQYSNEFELQPTEPSLPKGWAVATIGEAFEIVMGQSPPGSSYNSGRNGKPLLNGPTEFGITFPTPLQWTTMPIILAKKGDLLICVRGNTTGRMNWSDKTYCVGRGLAAIRNRNPKLSLRLLFYFLKLKTSELMSHTTGSTFPNLKSDELKGFLFPLQPSEEQQVIVEEIDDKLSMTDNTEKTIDRMLVYAESLRQSILKFAFEGKLVLQDPGNEPATTLLQRIQAHRSNAKHQKRLSVKLKSKIVDAKQKRVI